MVLGDYFRRNVAMYADKTAFIHEERRLTFAELDARVNRLIHALTGLGLEKGDRVAILAKNCIPFMEVYGSSEKGGLVTVPLNFRRRERSSVTSSTIRDRRRWSFRRSFSPP